MSKTPAINGRLNVLQHCLICTDSVITFTTSLLSKDEGINSLYAAVVMSTAALCLGGSGLCQVAVLTEIYMFIFLSVQCFL